MAKRKKTALARRYGHASVGDVLKGARDVASGHPGIVSGILGAGAAVGLTQAQLDMGPAALVGAVAGMAITEIVRPK